MATENSNNERLELIRKIAEQAPVAMIASYRGKIEVFNEAAQNIFKYSRDEIVGQSPDKLYRDRKKAHALGRALAENREIVDETEGRRKDGSFFPLRLTVKSFGREISLGYIEDQTFTSKTIFDIGEKLLAAKESDAVLDIAAHELHRVAHAWWVSALIVDTTGAMIGKIKEGPNTKKEAWLAMREKGYTQKIFTKKEPIWIEDVGESGSGVNAKVVEFGVRAVCGLPLVYQEKSFGVIWIHFMVPQVFSDERKDTLKAIVNQVAIAFVEARDYERQQAVAKAVKEMSGAASVAGVLEILSEKSKEILDLPMVAARLYDKEERCYLSCFNSAFPEKDIDRQSKFHPFSPNGQSAAQNETDQKLIMPRVDSRFIIIMFLAMAKSIHLERRVYAHLLTMLNQAIEAIKKLQLADQMKAALSSAGRIAHMGALGPLGKNRVAIVDEIQRLFHCRFAALVSCDPESHQAREFTLAGAKVGQVRKDLNFLTTADYQKEVMAAEELWQETIENSAYVKSSNLKTLIHHYLALPLRFEGKNLGHLTLLYENEHTLDQQEKETLRLLTNLVANSLQNGLLLENNARHEDALRGLLESAAITIENRERVYELLAEQGSRLLKLDEGRGLVQVWLIEKNRCELVANTGKKPAKGSVIDLFKEQVGVVGTCAKDGQTRRFADIRDSKNFISVLSEMQACMVTPVETEGRVIGVLYAEHRELAVFDEHLELVFKALAAQTSIAIQFSRVFDDLRRLGGLIGNRTAIDWISMISNTWGHHIKREVGTARTQIELIKMEFEQELRRTAMSSEKIAEKNKHLPDEDAIDPEIKDALEMLGVMEQALVNLANLPMTAPLTVNDQTKDLDLGLFVDKFFPHQWEQQGYDDVQLVMVVSEEPMMVRASPNWLGRLFEVVVENAVRAMRFAFAQSGRKKEFKVRALIKDQEVMVYMRDTGPGIPQKLKKAVFARTIDKGEGGQGAGIGLMLAKTIAQTYSGDLTVNETLTSGAEFILALPLQKNVELEDEKTPTLFG